MQIEPVKAPAEPLLAGKAITRVVEGERHRKTNEKKVNLYFRFLKNNQVPSTSALAILFEKEAFLQNLATATPWLPRKCQTQQEWYALF